MNNQKSIYEVIAEEITNSDVSESEKLRLNKKLLEYQEKKINLMIIGCTGCGKSSTINALFDMERDPAYSKQELAKIGTGVDAETMDISRYELGNLILWDSPGLGDGKDRDAQHRRNIINKLNERDDNGDLLIDLVLFIIDGSNRDMIICFAYLSDGGKITPAT